MKSCFAPTAYRSVYSRSKHCDNEWQAVADCCTLTRLFVLFSVALQPPIVPRIRHTGDTRNFFEYPEQNWQSWYEKAAADTVKQQVL